MTTNAIRDYLAAIGSAGGKIGGKARSAAKSAASRANGKKGGRPKIRRPEIETVKPAQECPIV